MCIAIANNQVNQKFNHHIDTRRYFVSDLVKDGVMNLTKCAGVKNVADALTKSLQGPSWSLHQPCLMGMRQKYEAFFLTLWVCGHGGKGDPPVRGRGTSARQILLLSLPFVFSRGHRTWQTEVIALSRLWCPLRGRAKSE